MLTCCLNLFGEFFSDCTHGQTLLNCSSISTTVLAVSILGVFYPTRVVSIVWVCLLLFCLFLM